MDKRARRIDKEAAAIIIIEMSAGSKYFSKNESEVALAVIELCATKK